MEKLGEVVECKEPEFSYCSKAVVHDGQAYRRCGSLTSCRRPDGCGWVWYEAEQEGVLICCCSTLLPHASATDCAMSSMFLGLTVFSALLSVSSAQYGRYILASPGVPPPLPAAYFDSPYGAPPPPPAQPYYIQSYALQAPPPPPAFPYGAPYPPPPQFSPIPEQPFGPPPSPFGPPPPPFAMPPPPPPFAMPPPFGPPSAFAPPPPFGAYGPPPPPAFMPPPPAFSPPLSPPLPPPVAVPAPIGIPFAVPVPTPAYLCKMAPCKKESPPSVVIKLTGPSDSGPQNSPMGGMGGMQRNAPMNNGNSSPILRSPPAGMPAPIPVNGGGGRQMSPPMMNGGGGNGCAPQRNGGC
ncbi:hypothetical protein M3Y99_01132700 [Aphelenchoides fujianensis]|nr:hypothetical protein M3Y99_01132700 [Aphelenchoides fujianensis]